MLSLSLFYARHRNQKTKQNISMLGHHRVSVFHRRVWDIESVIQFHVYVVGLKNKGTGMENKTSETERINSAEIRSTLNFIFFIYSFPQQHE